MCLMFYLLSLLSSLLSLSLSHLVSLISLLSSLNSTSTTRLGGELLYWSPLPSPRGLVGARVGSPFILFFGRSWSGLVGARFRMHTCLYGACAAPRGGPRAVQDCHVRSDRSKTGSEQASSSPRAAQEVPKSGQERAKSGPRAAKTGPRASKQATRSLRASEKQ